MNKKVDPNTKHYFQVTSEKELAEVLSNKLLKHVEVEITVWEKGEDEKNAEIYLLKNFSAQTKTFNISPTGKLITTITGSVKTGKHILLKIPVDDKTNYFTGGILNFHKENLSYSIQINNEIFLSQQRSNFRLNASNVIQIQFKINQIVFHALDLSIGGTSFEIADTDLDQFTKGQIFEECALRFDRKNYHIPKAQVASLMPVLDENGKKTNKFKVGIAFIDLHHKVKDELHVKISVEARGDEMKKKFDAIFAKPNS